MALTPNPPTPRGKVIQTNGVNLYYEVHGQGMPLLRSFPQRSRYFNR